jgi:NADPH-dependent ferric siderophore reductase
LTSQGTAGGRFARAIQQRNLWAAEMSLRELGHPPSLEAALAYLDLLAEQKPEKLERAAVRWHGRLETEVPLLSLAESQLALAALAMLVGGERSTVDVLRRLLKRARPTLVPRVGP